jgi:hypothetical protein
MKEKFPHLYEYERRCRLISESDEEYYSKFKDEIRREQEESNSTWMERYKLGGDKKIHKVEK